MRSCKNLLMIILIVAGCGTITSAVLVSVGAGAVWTIVIALITPGVLAYVAFDYYKTTTAITSLANTLKKTAPGRIKVKSTSPVKILVDAIAQSTADFTQKAEDLEKRSSDLNLQFQLLQRQKQNTEAIIYSIRDAVIVADDFDRLIMANNASEDLFGFEFASAQAQPIDTLINHEELVELIVKSRQSKLGHVKHEITFEHNESPKIFDCIISCVKDDKEMISGVVAVLHDITREKEISQMKNEFVSHVSHELKTPLASITAYAEMLVDGEATDQESITEFCTIIQNQAQRLNRLIEDILNISRIESGLTKVEKKTLSLAMLVKDAIEMMKTYAAEKDITLKAQTDIIIDQVHADKDMISQVIINYLSNAVKYTPKNGSVSIEIQVNEADKIVQLKVSDTGHGIPPDDVEHVFDKFYRVDANKKYAKGTGLGLNLVKQIIEKVHDGKVFVTSTVDKGSTFGFELPLAAGQYAKTA